MNLYRISQTERTGYDTFDMAVVAAESEDRARKIHPYSDLGPGYDWQDGGPSDQWASSAWCSSPGEVTARLIGFAVDGTPEGVILASFNAGWFDFWDFRHTEEDSDAMDRARHQRARGKAGLRLRIMQTERLV